MTLYKRNCNTCGNYYEGQGKYYCRKKCHNTSWNKGLTKETDERVRKSSENMKGTNIGRVVWNAGLTKEDDIRIQKFSERMKLHNPMKDPEIVKKVSVLVKGTQSGEKHWNFGGTISNEHKEILRISNSGKIHICSERRENCVKITSMVVLIYLIVINLIFISNKKKR